jgi:hypothetical protein
MMNTHCEQRHGNGPAHGNRSAKGNGKRNVEVCPYCLEKDEVIPIVYGFPSHEGFKRADRGEVYLGGCRITPATYYCKRDDREF